jgi:hypothetical protein
MEFINDPNVAVINIFKQNTGNVNVRLKIVNFITSSFSNNSGEKIKIISMPDK